MRAIVEFGVPGSALPDRPTGVSGQIIFPSVAKADKAARQVHWVLSKGQGSPHCMAVSRATPRKTFWSADRSFWIAVSLLDGEARGSYAARADREVE